MKCQVATCDGECGRDARYVARDVKLATCDEKGSETKDVHMCEEHMMTFRLDTPDAVFEPLAKRCQADKEA